MVVLLLGSRTLVIKFCVLYVVATVLPNGSVIKIGRFSASYWVVVVRLLGSVTAVTLPLAS